MMPISASARRARRHRPDRRGVLRFAQAPPAANPACQRLEAQLTSLDRGNADPARAAANSPRRRRRQPPAIRGRPAGRRSRAAWAAKAPASSRSSAIRRRNAGRSTGRSTSSARARTHAERPRTAHGGTAERAAQRQSLLIALGNNGCGPQYRSAALAGQHGGFFDRLFGDNNSNVSSPPGADGRHLPHHLRAHLRRLLFPDFVRDLAGPFPRRRADLPAHVPGGGSLSSTPITIPGEEVTQAVSLNGRLYTELPTAFQYRKALDAACSCRRAGRKLGRRAQDQRPGLHRRAGRCRRHRRERQEACRSRASVADGKPIKYDPPPKQRRRRCRRSQPVCRRARPARSRPSARCAPSGRLSCRRARRHQKSKASLFAGLAGDQRRIGRGSGVPGSRNRLVIG